MKSLAVIGCGHWGRNIVSAFYRLLGNRLKIVCDVKPEALTWVKEHFPSVQTTTDVATVIDDGKIDAIAIATSAVTHFDLSKRALVAGKHVFVEKPLALKSNEAEELVRLSDERKRTLMVNHLLVYHPAVRKLKSLIDAGELGKIYYLYAQRLNLGKIRRDENVLWSLAPHDLAIIFYLFGDAVVEWVSAHGQAFLNKGVEDTVFLHISFRHGEMAHVHLSWLDPHKERKLTIVGDKKMAVFNDMEPVEKIKIYDKGVDPPKSVVGFKEFYTLRFGDVVIPKIAMQEPLLLACQCFMDAVANGKPTLSSAREGMRVVRTLAAAQRSLTAGGKPQTMNG